MRNISLMILVIIIITSCSKKNETQYTHDFYGVWEIQKMERYIKNTDETFKLDSSWKNVGYFQLYDNISWISGSNNCIFKINDEITTYCTKYLGFYQSNNGSCYWYADDNMRLTIWYKYYINYIEYTQYSTLTVNKKRKNKHEWTFYCYKDDSTEFISPYLEPNIKEVYTVKRKSN